MIVKPAGLSDEEQIEIMMEILGVDEVKARFIMAIERRQIEGDVIELTYGETLPENTDDYKPRQVRRPQPGEMLG